MRSISLIVLFFLGFDSVIFAQSDSTQSEGKEPSKFDQFNQKAEKLFKIIPVPLYSYSTEAGHIVGLAKYNLIDMDKRDTISQPSRIAEVVSFSTEGRINMSVSTDFIWNENKYMVLGFINYRKQNEYVFGIGNDVIAEDLEQYGFSRFRFVNTGYLMVAKDLYVGLGFDISDYTDLEYDTTGILVQDDAVGLTPNTNFGINLATRYDSRDNRYNPFAGEYASLSYTFYPEFIGSQYQYSKFNLDLRKYYNPWYKHVIAMQATTTFCTGEVPFYDLALMGGENTMRGYYQGALRDRVLVDTQVEYRMPIWSIFGLTTWVGTGRVAHSYEDLSLDGFWISYGVGLRLMVDSEHQTNLRFDWGFGQNRIKGFYINFAEAF
ncbi:BamA/TamA family outer membrane protein [Owenweeksia hongkongensis]|uniref:BamA/TamA family outer membrane protein n=1 Tax=Owenweeksia hongkongensis TaxID=253245 RepID=UPI003A8CD5BA